MGQKVNPHGMRVGVIKDWDSRWFTSKQEFGDTLVEDHKIRKTLKKQLYAAGVPKIEIERTVDSQTGTPRVKVNVFCAKPGIVIGKGGAESAKIEKQLAKLTGKNVNLNIVEVKGTTTNAQLVAEDVASQLERRIAFRRAMKQVIRNAMQPRGGVPAKGIKVTCSGRLAGADIARVESYHEGTIPLQTLRADIDYGFAEANTTYGKVGVKVWIYKGEILKGAKDPRQEGRRQTVMLLPKRVKYRRVQRGRMTGKAMRGNTVNQGQYGLVALEPAWITSNQIEAARVAMTRYIKRGGKVWIKIFPDKPVTEKPAGTRMGSGKGSPEYWVAVVKPGRVLFELADVDEATARESLRLASNKLPIRCKFVKREELDTVKEGDAE